MFSNDQQSTFDNAINLVEEAEAVMVGVEDPWLWREVYRAGSILQRLISNDEPSAWDEPFGDEPEFVTGSQTARAIALVEAAGVTMKDVEEPGLRVMFTVRLAAMNALMVCGGDLDMPIGIA